MAEINVSPGHGVAGRHPTREFVDTLSGHDDPGMFGRMFPTLPKFRPEDSKLDALAETMRDISVAPTSANGELKIDPGDNKNVPSGFTYLGQFIDHDVTLDLTSLAEKQEDPNATRNFRTPRLDLDAIYGLGPDGSPQLYARNGSKAGASPGPKFLIGKNMELPDPAGAFRNDLPRSPEGFALIGDHRNDENLIVAQTHLAFLKFHNKVVDMLAGGATPSNALFAEARRIVTWHYQWMVLHDFVERLTEDGIIDSILEKGRQFYRFQTTPYMPIEFSAAAYRLGHSMVRERYSHNRIFDNTGFNLLFKFTGLSGDVQGEDGQFKTVPSNWIIDWRRWYDFKTPPGDFPPPLERRDEVRVQLLTADRSLHRAHAPHLAGRRRKSGSAQPEAGRASRPAVRPGRCQGDEDQEPAHARRDRDRPRRQGRGAAGPASKNAALVLHPQGGAGAQERPAARAGGFNHGRGSLPRARPWRPRFFPVDEKELEARVTGQEARYVHYDRFAPVCGRRQPDRRGQDGHAVASDMMGGRPP
jgi:Animal haem peroxidase